jgi:hypothetical protein
MGRRARIKNMSKNIVVRSVIGSSPVRQILEQFWYPKLPLGLEGFGIG